MTRLLLVAALLGAGCRGGSGGDPAPADPDVFVRTTQGGHYKVEVRFDPPRPEMGSLFAATARVTDKDGQPLEHGAVRLNALMPHHGHGMETDPVDDPGTCDDDGCTHPDGLYRTEGFKFHMPGAWTVTVDVQGHRGPDNTTFVVEQR